MTSFKKLFLFSSIFIFLLASVPVFSDVDTTSSLRGNVNVSGASVVVEHTPTGTTKAVTAGASGNFSLTFLPIGGPYEITVSSPGYQTAKLGGIYLALNETESVSGFGLFGLLGMVWEGLEFLIGVRYYSTNYTDFKSTNTSEVSTLGKPYSISDAQLIFGLGYSF